MCGFCVSSGFIPCEECTNPTWNARPPGALQNRFHDAQGRVLCSYCVEGEAPAA